MERCESIHLGRRAFLRSGSLILAAAAGWGSGVRAQERSRDREGANLPNCSPTVAPPPRPPVLRVGLVADLHYADKPPAGSRHYHQTPGKLAEAAERFSREQPDFVVELGDFIDAADSVETEQRYLKRINRDFAAVSKDRHYVLGNHCVDTLTKQEFLDGVEQERPHYSFDRGGLHFVVLDSCFREDGEPYGRKNFHWTDANIPAGQIEWLQADLKATDRKAVVLAHQRLDVSNNYSVRNAPDVRRILENAGNVLAVFQGHSHQNDYREIGGIHYCTLVAMVEGSGAENNGYSLMDIHPNGTITLTGFRRQQSHTWEVAC
jgi:predicted phosphodiesterase